MRDIQQPDLAGIEHVRRQFKRLSDLYGFMFMDPSPIELLSVLKAKSGPAIMGEVYHFKDKGGRDVALRFDFTVGLTRYAASQKTMRLPAKISSFGGVFRYDEPQKGRYRYFHQWDLEIYGKPCQESEAEIIEVTSRLFDSLQLSSITIDINHRKLVESYIDMLFGSRQPQMMGDLLRAVDKSSKKSREAIIKEFGNKYDKQKLSKLLDFAHVKGTIRQVEKIFDTSQIDSWNELVSLFELLENRGVSNARINFGIVRGLDYYSGMVFEVFDTSSTLGALAGGGRYDSLTSAFGRDDMGAAGVAGGVERIIMAMRDQNLEPERPRDSIPILYVNADMQKIAISIASLLRLNGIPADVDLAGRSLKKQMEALSTAITTCHSNIAIIVGPRELQEGNVILHDMQTGTEGTIALEKIRENPKTILSP